MLAFYLDEALRQKLTGIQLKLRGDFHEEGTLGSLPDGT
jgi:hypothetical protein